VIADLRPALAPEPQEPSYADRPGEAQWGSGCSSKERGAGPRRL